MWFSPGEREKKFPHMRRGEPGRQQDKGTKDKEGSPPRSEQGHHGERRGDDLICAGNLVLVLHFVG